jgi:uncharacterized protein (TIGR00369 family)
LIMNSTDIPEGFEPHFRKSPFTDPWEPLYSKRTDKAVIIGLRLAHTNARGNVHGGLIATLADNAMGYSCGQATDWTSSLATVTFSVDFIGIAQIGQWLTVESDMIKTGRTICFAHSLIKADDKVIARANATFRVVPKRPELRSRGCAVRVTDGENTELYRTPLDAIPIWAKTRGSA